MDEIMKEAKDSGASMVFGVMGKIKCAKFKECDKENCSECAATVNDALNNLLDGFTGITFDCRHIVLDICSDEIFEKCKARIELQEALEKDGDDRTVCCSNNDGVDPLPSSCPLLQDKLGKDIVESIARTVSKAPIFTEIVEDERIHIAF
jgi:hypothetical protein